MLEIDVTKDAVNDYWKVDIKGRFVAAYVEKLSDVLEDNKLNETPNVLFDLSDMTHIDSMGLGEMVKTLQKCKHRNGIAIIYNLQPHPRIVFDITKVFRVFEIYDSLEEAKKNFEKS